MPGAPNGTLHSLIPQAKAAVNSDRNSLTILFSGPPATRSGNYAVAILSSSAAASTMGSMEARVDKRVRGDTVYFTVQWSTLKKADKYDIISSVPSMGGVFELYYRDDRKRLVLIERSRAWYGGLRARIRKAVDPELQPDAKLRHILEEYDLYYRYSLLESRPDMIDIIYFFERARRRDGGNRLHSGRFKTIYLKELSDDKIINVE